MSNQLTKQRFETQWIGKTEWLTIPATKSWFALPFLMFWLTAWSLGGLAAVGALINGPDRAFIAVWLVFWVFGWLFAASSIAWQLAGKYQITIEGGELKYAWSMPFLSKLETYDLLQIQNLQPIEPFRWPIIGAIRASSTFPPFLQRLSQPNPARSIMFIYGKKIKTLDLGLDEKDTEIVIDWLKGRAEELLES